LRSPEEDKSHWRRSNWHLDGRPLGSIPWQTLWPVTSAAGLPQPSRTAAAAAPVVRLMEGETGRFRFAKAPAAKGLALNTAGTLAALRIAEARGVADPTVPASVAGLFPSGAPLVPEWDSAEQLFFGLAALEYAKGPPGAAVVTKYQKGVGARRARDWDQVKDVFGGLR